MDSSLCLALAGCFFWGSWSAPLSSARMKAVPFALVLLDVALGFLIAATALLTWRPLLFSAGDTSAASLALSVGVALASGAVHQSAEGVILGAQRAYGIAATMPPAIGTALVLGTAGMYAVDRRGSLPRLAAGVSLALAAICALVGSRVLHQRHAATAVASAAMPASAGAESGSALQGRELTCSTSAAAVSVGVGAEPAKDLLPPHVARSVVRPGDGRLRDALRPCLVAIGGGLMLCLWSPLAALPQVLPNRSARLTGEGACALLLVAKAAASVPLALVINGSGGRGRLFGPRQPRLWRAWACHPARERALGMMAGLGWAGGTVCTLLAGRGAMGFAMAYAIGETAPMVGALWGLLCFRELEGAPASAWAAQGAMFALYISAIALIAGGRGGEPLDAGDGLNTNTGLDGSQSHARYP